MRQKEGGVWRLVAALAAASCGGGGQIIDGPHVAAPHFPASAGGTMDVTLDLAGLRGEPVTVSVEVSPDGAPTFRPCAADPPVVSVSGSGGKATFTWRSLDDVGFHASGRPSLRFVVTDAMGAGPPMQFQAPALDNLRAAARRVDHYLANYGSWTDATLAEAKRYQLVITYPSHAQLTRATVQALQAGPDPSNPADDVIVLCYVSVGEDLRTAGLSDAEIRTDPRLRGDGSGPRIDPRGPNADGSSLNGIDPHGAPSNGGTGFASYYLDDDDVHASAAHVGDGIPDRNPIFGSLFVNAGDPAWFGVVDGMTLDSDDKIAGLGEALTANRGRGLDCDGVFLDTIDTAAPNKFTGPGSPNETKFEWTAPGFEAFIRHVHQAYPAKLLLQNRGLFFFDPRHPHYAFNARGAIDFVLFESYRLNSNKSELWNAFFFPDNQNNVAPKLMAEANRPDGFRVLSLGYAEGPADQISTATLLGQSTLGLDTLLEDIRVTQQLAGFRHYLTDAQVTLVNDFVLTHADLEDHTPPQWTSTYNDNPASPPGPPTPRVGLQRATGGGGQITVAWDVALDEHDVRYVLYAQTTPFDFAADPTLSRATAIALVPDVGHDYVKGVGPDRFPYEQTLLQFPPAQMQYLLLRAVDDSPNANQDGNTVVLTATP